MSAPDNNDSDEKKVRDLVRPPGADEGDRLDADQIAQIVHWFGLPSIEEAHVPGDPDAEVTNDELTLRKRAVVASHIDRAMIAYVDRHAGAGDAIRRLRNEPERPWENARLLQLREDLVPPVPTEDSWPEVYIPDQLKRDLRIRAPQAQLRDLHRPEKVFGIHYQPPWDDAFQAAPADAIAAVREAFRSHFAAAAAEANGFRAAAPAFADLRATLALPWADAKREAARAREAELLAAEAGKGPDVSSVERGPEKGLKSP